MTDRHHASHTHRPTRRWLVLALASAPGALALGLASRHGVNASEPIAAQIRQIVQAETSPDAKLTRLMPAITGAMGTDRCFIYMRDPVRRMTAYTHGHTALRGWRQYGGGRWSREPDPRTLAEPMLKKAFSDPTALFIEDIETAPPGVLNAAMERAVFGHRALVHAPIWHAGTFYGILETAVRDRPRRWSPADRALIIWLQPRVASLAAEYLHHQN